MKRGAYLLVKIVSLIGLIYLMKFWLSMDLILKPYTPILIAICFYGLGYWHSVLDKIHESVNGVEDEKEKY